MLSEMSLCKVCCSERAAVVGRASVEKWRNCEIESTRCGLGQGVSRAATGSSFFWRKTCPMRLAFQLGRRSVKGSSIGVEGGGVAKYVVDLGLGTLNANAVKHEVLNCAFRVSFTSLTRFGTSPLRKIPSGRLHCNVGARLSDASTASPAAEGVASNATSTSVSSSQSLVARGLPVNLIAGVGITAAVIMMAVLGFMAKPSKGGSVADLIRRGQLRSDRTIDSKNLMFDDPFNNPLVKMGNKNPIVKMCGKMFRLAPVTLTEEKMLKHQNRRIQAYKWRRPMVFLNEGEPVPEGVDPEEVRWIPSNHPFATTSNSIDEELAQKNVYQTRGVPSRLRAEHEALRKKILETARLEPEFQLPSLENSGSQAWKTLDGTSETSGSLSEDEGQGQVNGKGGGNSHRNGGVQGGTRSGASDSRYRTIDFSGEEQGSGRS